MGQGKQAKILTEVEVHRVLNSIRSRYTERDRLMFLLSVRAGLRAVEIARLRWSMVTQASGALDDCLRIPNRASKGKQGGRTIPMHVEIHEALQRMPRRGPGHCVIVSQRGDGLSPASIHVWFHSLFAQRGFTGASSHSGRRTFITRAARRIHEVGGSLRDVQELAGHASLTTTQRYIQGDTEAQRRLVKLL